MQLRSNPVPLKCLERKKDLCFQLVSQHRGRQKQWGL